MITMIATIYFSIGLGVVINDIVVFWYRDRPKGFEWLIGFIIIAVWPAYVCWRFNNPK